MALPSVTNNTLTANQANSQVPKAGSEQLEKRQLGHSSENNTAGNKTNDSVTLNQSATSKAEDVVESGKALDATSAGNLLKDIMQTIMTKSETAISTQANMSPQSALSLLAD